MRQVHKVLKDLQVRLDQQEKEDHQAKLVKEEILVSQVSLEHLAQEEK